MANEDTVKKDEAQVKPPVVVPDAKKAEAVKKAVKKDEAQVKPLTIEQRVAQLETTQSWVSGIIRIAQKELKNHFGIKLGVMLFAFGFATFTFAATDIANWGTGVSGTLGNAKLSTDGTYVTMEVDKIIMRTSGTLSNATLAGGTYTSPTLTTPTINGSTLNGAVTMNGVMDVGTGATVTGNVSSSTSKYNMQILPDGSVNSATGRTDGVHIGSEANCASTSNGLVGLYVSVGRAAGNNAAAGWTAGSPDTGLRAVAINKATNNATAYDIEGAYIKAKNYSSGTVKGVHGLRVEAVNDGTDTAGSSYGIGISSDSSTLDYGVDMNEMAAPAYGEIRFSNGQILRITGTSSNIFLISADNATTNRFVMVAGD